MARVWVRRIRIRVDRHRNEIVTGHLRIDRNIHRERQAAFAILEFERLTERRYQLIGARVFTENLHEDRAAGRRIGGEVDLSSDVSGAQGEAALRVRGRSRTTRLLARIRKAAGKQRGVTARGNHQREVALTDRDFIEADGNLEVGRQRLIACLIGARARNHNALVGMLEAKRTAERRRDRRRGRAGEHRRCEELKLCARYSNPGAEITDQDRKSVV